MALLAFCYSFWAAAVSGAAVAANPRRRATARREGARAHSYASRGAAAVPWAGRSGHTVAILGAHGGASKPWGLGPTRRARRKNSPIPSAGHPTPRGPVGAEVGLRWPSRGPGRLITSRWWVRLIGFACGRGAFQAFLRRFSGVSPAILAPKKKAKKFRASDILTTFPHLAGGVKPRPLKNGILRVSF